MCGHGAWGDAPGDRSCFRRGRPWRSRSWPAGGRRTGRRRRRGPSRPRRGGTSQLRLDSTMIALPASSCARREGTHPRVPSQPHHESDEASSAVQASLTGTGTAEGTKRCRITQRKLGAMAMVETRRSVGLAGLRRQRRHAMELGKLRRQTSHVDVAMCRSRGSCAPI